MTCRCGHPFRLHMALVRGKPFLLNGRCCQYMSPLITTLPARAGEWFAANRFGCNCQEFVRA